MLYTIVCQGIQHLQSNIWAMNQQSDTLSNIQSLHSSNMKNNPSHKFIFHETIINIYTCTSHTIS
jgi:hypothetical protein